MCGHDEFRQSAQSRLAQTADADRDHSPDGGDQVRLECLRQSPSFQQEGLPQ